jgi:biotin--protein ligase
LGNITHRFAAVNLDPKADGEGFPKVVDALAQDDKPRTDFLKACLVKLGLQVNQDQNTVPSLSRLHLTSLRPSNTSQILDALRDIITTEDGEEYIKDENDTFHLERPSAWSTGSLAGALFEITDGKTDVADSDEDRILDYRDIVKRLIVHDKDHPSSKETPYFNHHAYYANIQYYHSLGEGTDPAFGRNLLYGEVVTSTNTMLEK